jgi:glycosyltransferase involved in cell wall biosynthesis
MQPLVSVICLCYNHASFLREALDSVRQQTYSNLEIILVDDASTDNSAQVLKEYLQPYPEIKFIHHLQNTGNTRAFNEAFALSQGEFVIDFATDDVMLPHRVEEQVKAFAALDPDYGVVYTDAELINNQSAVIGHFYQRNAAGQVISLPPSGYVFTHILRSAFLCPPTLMFRRQLLAYTRGYDENLAYEDFDVWVRSAQQFKFYFLDKILTRRRMHAQSFSEKLYSPGDKQLAATVIICRKALKLVQTPEEKAALVVRVKSEMRQAFFTQNFKETLELAEILQHLQSLNTAYKLLTLLAQKEVRLGFLRRLYYKIKYGKN